MYVAVCVSVGICVVVCVRVVCVSLCVCVCLLREKWFADTRLPQKGSVGAKGLQKIVFFFFFNFMVIFF